MTTNIVKASFGTLQKVKTRSVYQHDYGQVLQLFGVELPTSYEVHFSNNESGSTSIIVIGDDTGAKIPDSLLETGKPVYAWLFLHTGNEDGETVREVEIPVISKSKPESVTPTPHEQSVIEQAISALNDAVEQTAADVETTTANAQAAAQSEANAAISERSAAASAGAAILRTVSKRTNRARLSLCLSTRNDNESRFIRVLRIPERANRATLFVGQGIKIPGIAKASPIFY